MSKTFLLCLLYLFSARPCPAQLHWQRMDSAYKPLPPSIHVYRSADSLEGFPSIAYYVSARLKDKEIQFTTTTGQGKRFTPDQYFQIEQSPVIVVNCTF